MHIVLLGSVITNMSIFQKIINHKVNGISGKELFNYAQQFQIQVSPEDANKVANYLRGKNFNIFDPNQKVMIINEIQKITSPQIAQQVENLFTSLTK